MARDLRVAFGLWVWGVGYGLRAWVVGYGLRAVGYGFGAWVTDMGMGIGCACMRVAFRFGVRLFHFYILVVMNSRWIAA